ncbi:MAG: alpha/beta fold hydrolase [Saprospiraceae bacterium]|nr:alpha/beta fold hydrolase [Saprospiraceae bacterium]
MPSKTLLLLHGALGSAADFAPLQAIMHDRLHNVALDFPGHGPAAAYSGDFSMEAFAGFIAEQAVGPEKPDLFGYSMGGYAALLFAARYPDRVGRVFTLGTKLDWTPETGSREASRLNPQKIAEKVPHFAAALAQKHGAAHWENTVSRTARLLQSLGDQPPLDAAAFSRIEANVCIARGALDNMVSEQECLDAVAKMPHAHFLNIDHQPHLLDQCDPQVLALHLIRFFQD